MSICVFVMPKPRMAHPVGHSVMAATENCITHDTAKTIHPRHTDQGTALDPQPCRAACLLPIDACDVPARCLSIQQWIQTTLLYQQMRAADHLAFEQLCDDFAHDRQGVVGIHARLEAGVVENFQ